MTSARTHNANVHNAAASATAKKRGRPPNNPGQPPVRLSQQQKARDKSQLQSYLRANGNMSVARRTAVVGSALERLGYPRQQADEIALDAPLNAVYSDEKAVHVALQYAKSISQPIPQNQAPNINQLIQPDVIPMPTKAQTALQAYDEGEAPIQTRVNRGRTLGRRGVTNIANIFRPAVQKMGNLPSPGGIGGLFFINLLFLAAIVPANPQGYTRLQLLWYTLVGWVNMPSQKVPEEIPASPMVQAALGLAKSGEDIAVSIASLGQDAANVVSAIEAPGKAVAGAINQIPIVGGLLATGAAAGAGLGGGPTGTVLPPDGTSVPPLRRIVTDPPPPPVS